MKTLIRHTTRKLRMLFCVILIPMIGMSQLPTTQLFDQVEYVQGAIHLKVKEGVGPYSFQENSVSFGIPSLDELAFKYDAATLKKRFRHKPITRNSGLPDISRIYVLSFPSSMNVHQVAKEFSNDPNIEYAEAIPIYHSAEIPDDPMYGQQQHLPQIQADDAWDIHKGEDGAEVIVAIIDTGVDWLHPDLSENCWQNLGEDADGDGVTLEFNDGVWERDPDDLNGLDDDANGFADDLIGWDFHEDVTIGDGSNPDPLWFQGPYEHGTHCAGISAGMTNNGVGIASVSYNVSYMATQVDNGNDNFPYAWDAIIYAADNGADIISNSWGGPAYSEVGRETVEYAVGMGSIVVVAAHNYNTDQKYYPAAFPGSIAVSALNPNDTRAGFTNYGAWLDVAAPGVDILSTVTNGNYASWGGTSMATPMVAGQFALLKSYQPAWTNDQLIEQIIGTADNIDELNPGYEKQLGSGRINAFRTLDEENVEVLQELRLEFLAYSMEDENGDGSLESGESASISFSMRNFTHLVSDDNATFSLTSFDPDIEITKGTISAEIPTDGVFEIEEAFEFTVAENADPHIADFLIEVTSEKTVVFGSETEIIALIAPSGMFVWEGDPNQPDYSGAFIRDYLEARGHDVMYSNYYPLSFAGFDATFLSFANAGENVENGTLLEYPMSLPIQDYLENGGTMYTEGSPFLLVPEVVGFPNGDVFAGLFGASSVTTNYNIPNPISRLIGAESSIGDGMEYNSSTQQYNWYIDNITPGVGAEIPFTEEGYGNVAINNTGEFGQKTFHFSYSLAELVDEDTHSSRYNVMREVMAFFGYPEEEGYVVANFEADKTEGLPELQVQFSDWSLTDTDTEITGWAWDFNEDGEIDSYDQNPIWTFTEGGVFDVMLVVSSADQSDTLIKTDYITVRSGILVYEGQAGANGYSGSFIHSYLQDHWYDEVGYTNNFPSSLQGYNAVFLSFGNTGMRGTEMSPSMASAVFNYGLAGGNIYLEGGDALVNHNNLWMVFGLSTIDDGETKMLETLMGMEGSIMEGLEFNGSNQLSQRSIDAYTTFEDIETAKVAFEEGDYGNVAVEFDGTEVFGQKAFCMSYAIADLEDGEDMSTGNEVLKRILNFFDVTVSVEDQLAKEVNPKFKIYPNPASERLNIEFSLEESQTVYIEIFDLTGRMVYQEVSSYTEGSHRISHNIHNFYSGVYYLRLQAGEKVRTVKWLKVE